MKPKVFIIEDQMIDYIETVKRIDLDKFDIIPWYKDEEKNDFALQERAFNNHKLLDYVRDTIQSNFSTLRVILCDLRFNDSYYENCQGDYIIQYIRNSIEIPQLKLFTRLIPIIAYTKYSDQPIAKSALLSGATQTINKNDKVFFSEIIEAASSYFKSAFIDREILDIEKYLNDFLYKNKELLADNNKLITTGFSNLEFLIKGNQQDITDKFDILFKAVFTSMDTDKQKKFYDSFKEEIENLLSDEQKKKMEQGIWDQIKDSIKDINKEGGFKQFVDTTYEILDSAGLLGVKGKVLGSAIKGAFGLISIY